MYGFGFLILIGVFVMALVALGKISKLESRLAQLKLQLGNLVDELDKLRHTGLVPAPPPVKPKAAILAKPVEPVAAEPAAPPPAAKWQPAAARVAAPKRDMEQALASRWFVWIGGIAIAIGGLLFVKYAYDEGLIPPALQIVLGLLLGGALVAAGEALRRKPLPQPVAGLQPDYVPQALAAAGLVIAFGSIYAAYALYELVAPLAAFIGLAALGLGALALSLRQGPMIAALGLIGSYGTPSLIPSPDPNAWSFFPYLLAILAAGFAILRRRTWWWLGYAAIVGSALWALLWLKGGVFETADIPPIGFFALALGGIAVFAITGRAILEEATGTLLAPKLMAQPLVIAMAGLAAAAVVLAVLVGESDHTTLGLVFFFAGMAGLVALAWLKHGLAALAPAAALLSLIVLMAWREAAFHEFAMDESGVWTSLLGGDALQFLRWMLAAALAFTLAGLAGLRLKPAPVIWPALAAGSALLFVFGAWGRVDALLDANLWALLGAGFALALIAAVWSMRQRLAKPPVDLACGILACGAAALLLFALDRLFDGVWLTLAIAALAAAYAYGTNVIGVRLLGPIAVALASLAALRLFISRELWLDDRDLPLGQHWVIYGYGVPVLLFFVASRWLKAKNLVREAMSLEGLSLGLAISLVSLELRVLIGGGVTDNEPRLLEMAAHSLTWLAAAYGLMYRQQVFSSFISMWGARLLIAVSCAAILLLSLLALNPVVTGDAVPGNLVFNALLLAYLAPVILLGLIARKLAGIGWDRLRPAAGLLALVLALAYVTLETKRVFQGPMMVPWSESLGESYAYSAVWLASALALFIAGIRLARQYIRYAGLGVMVLVVLKVFLSDMSDLEGLYRIASFIGLGLCLVGIGWLYARFVQKQEGEPKQA